MKRKINYGSRLIFTANDKGVLFNKLSEKHGLPRLYHIEAERARGQHLKLDDRGAIQRLHKLGYSNRAIARETNCLPTTIGKELYRGTPAHMPGRRGRKPGYSARRGQASYEANRKHCHKPHRILCCEEFTLFVVKQVREHRWSLDACVGYARLHGLFEAD